MRICIVHYQNASDALPLPIFGTDVYLISPQPNTSQHCKTMDGGQCIKWHVRLLPSFSKYSLCLPTDQGCKALPLIGIGLPTDGWPG